MTGKSHLGLITVIVTALVALGGTGCATQSPILVGYAGELSGSRAELGVAGRDGAQLAVDVINQQGGVQGRPLKLLVRDDEGKPDSAREVDAELVKAGVITIIGHMTSGQTAAVFKQMNEARVVLFSPTASSTDFSGQADYFFRMLPNTDLLGSALAEHIYARGVRSLIGIYDVGNESHTKALWLSAQKRFAALGGRIDGTLTFKSGNADLQSVMNQVAARRPEAVAFVSSAVDTALMAQYGRQQGLTAQYFSVPWSQTPELFQKGGKAIEGMELVALYNPQNSNPVFQEFLQRFQDRYHRLPDFGAAYSYETVLALAQALQQTGGQAAGLPAALSRLQNLQGIQGKISLDAYGDVIRDVYIVKAADDHFQVIDTVSPAP